jgi:hypothetical protein
MSLSFYADAPRAIRLFPARTLQRLVRRHAAACAALGLATAGLEDADDTTMGQWLAERAGVLPAALAEDLERIDELTDDRGVATMIEVGARAGIDVRSLGLDPMEVAVRAFLDHQDIFESAHGKRIVETLKGTTEFVGKATGGLRAVSLDALHALETDLGQHFDARARTRHCRISMGRDGDRLVFTIAHGALVRADEALDHGALMVCEPAAPVYLPERPVRYRPQRRDVVVYDTKAGQLRIRAGDAPTLHAYRRGFGQLLHGDARWFGTDAIVSLQPLARLGRAVERPTAGLADVRVVGLIVRYTTGQRGTVAIDADDIWAFLEARMRTGLEHGELTEVIFHVYRPGVYAPTKVKVRSPNRVEYGRMDDELFRTYLEERGFLATTASRMTG